MSLRLNGSTSGYSEIDAPAVAGNNTLVLPTGSGSADQVLKTDGNGVLGWATVPAFATTAEVGGTHTTGSVTSGSDQLTVASATGIVAGMYIVGEGIAPGTTVSSIVSTTVTMSANAGATLSSDPVAFYIADKSLSPGLVAGQLCRAWVNFNGTGTVAIRASYNVSSITDNGTGVYTVNFTTALPDANYAVHYSSGPSGGGGTVVEYGGTTPTTTSVRVVTYFYSTGANADRAHNSVSIFR